MLVYGDRSLSLDPRLRMAEALDRWRAACALTGSAASLRRAQGRKTAERRCPGAGLARHAGLVAAFILAAELAQGLADAAFAGAAMDEPDPASAAAMQMLLRMAAGVAESWDCGFAAVPQAVEACPETTFPGRVTCREPEGYAYYALYPEAYAEAASTLPDVPHRVIGLRSIGTGLAAIVAARTRASMPATLRPHGHPFRRVVTPGPLLSRRILSDSRARFVVVDEGPGLSGSSFGAVCDWLEGHGVAAERITLLTGHGSPPGNEADPRDAARWPRLDRRCVPFEDLVLFRASHPGHQLDRWVSDALHAPAHLVADLSGGAWRQLLYPGEEFWPASDTMQERRKLLFATPTGPVLARFAGLGVTGERKLARARALFAAGVVPEPLGLVHGFLLERWHGDARPLSRADAARDGLMDRLAVSIGQRSRAFPAQDTPGATLIELAAMTVRNVSEALGEAAAHRFAVLADLAERLQPAVRPVETDGRMDAQEWLALPDGRILKADALDHHAAHDLVGCQDPAWDVAGAAVEFGLDRRSTERLRRDSEGMARRPILPALVDFYRPCWIAFRIGMFSMAEASHAGQPAEQGRLRARLREYTRDILSSLPGAW